MGWEQFALLIIQVGLPLALRIYDNVQKRGQVTPEEIAELRAYGAQTAQTQMRDALLRAGINLEDQHAKNLIALVTPPTPAPTPPPN